jgi:hypothetical protein
MVTAETRDGGDDREGLCAFRARTEQQILIVKAVPANNVVAIKTERNIIGVARAQRKGEC